PRSGCVRSGTRLPGSSGSRCVSSWPTDGLSQPVEALLPPIAVGVARGRVGEPALDEGQQGGFRIRLESDFDAGRSRRGFRIGPFRREAQLPGWRYHREDSPLWIPAPIRRVERNLPGRVDCGFPGLDLGTKRTADLILRPPPALEERMGHPVSETVVHAGCQLAMYLEGFCVHDHRSCRGRSDAVALAPRAAWQASVDATHAHP